LKHYYAGKPTIYMASTREEMMGRVHDEGLDPHEVTRRGLLTLIPAQDAYLKNPTFTPEYMRVHAPANHPQAGRQSSLAPALR
jgi:hypothetical protein